MGLWGVFEISEGNITGRGENTHTHTTEYAPNHNSQWRHSPYMFATSEQGLIREVPAALLMVRTRTECPEDNLRELT